MMKRVFFTLILVFMSNNAYAASAVMPVKATIVNLTQLPVEEAVAFCDERNLACPAIRKKFERNIAPAAAVAEGNRGSEILRRNEAGYYIE